MGTFVKKIRLEVIEPTDVMKREHPSKPFLAKGEKKSDALNALNDLKGILYQIYNRVSLNAEIAHRLGKQTSATELKTTQISIGLEYRSKDGEVEHNSEITEEGFYKDISRFADSLIVDTHIGAFPKNSMNGIRPKVYGNIKYKEINKGMATFPKYTISISTYPLSKREIIFFQDGDEYVFLIQGIYFRTITKADRQGVKNTLAKISDGEFSICDSDLNLSAFSLKKKDNDKIYLNLVLSSNESNKVLFDKNRILGIDLGMRKPAIGCIVEKRDDGFIAIGNGVSFDENGDIKGIGDREESQYIPFKFHGKTYHIADTQFRNQPLTQIRLADIAKGDMAKKHCNLYGVSGHGRKAKMQEYDSMKSREKNHIKNILHLISKRIIEYAQKNNCGIIKVENLSNFNKQDENGIIVRMFGYYQLLNMIEYKAKLAGIEVYFVNPRNTSKTCFDCGTLYEPLRGEENWVCPKCGKEHDRDENAARNIARSEDYKKK